MVYKAFGTVTGGGLVTNLCPVLVTPWTVAHQAPLSMGFPREKYCSGLPFPSMPFPSNPNPNPGIEIKSSTLTGRFLTAEPPGKPIPQERYSHKLRLVSSLQDNWCSSIFREESCGLKF